MVLRFYDGARQSRPPTTTWRIGGIALNQMAAAVAIHSHGSKDEERDLAGGIECHGAQAVGRDGVSSGERDALVSGKRDCRRYWNRADHW